MTLRRSTACLLALGLSAGLLGGGPSFSKEGEQCLLSEAPYAQRAAVPPVHEQLKPLADLIAKGEGDYNSVNRGWAGDTPQGIKGLTGSSFAGFTVGRVLEMQRTWLYAVGRYQFIPRTLRFAVNQSNVNATDHFTPEVQDRLMAALILYKRPIIITYLQGNHNNLGATVDALAREWASIEYRSGRGYYDHVGGNRASVSRASVAQVLQTMKSTWQDGGLLP